MTPVQKPHSTLIGVVREALEYYVPSAGRRYHEAQEALTRLEEQLESANATIEILQDKEALSDIIASQTEEHERLFEQKETQTRALRAIAFNALSFHKGEDGKERALAVIAKWASDPDSVPEGIGADSFPASEPKP